MAGVYLGQWYKGKEIAYEKGEGVSYRDLETITGRDKNSLKKWHDLSMSKGEWGIS